MKKSIVIIMTILVFASSSYSMTLFGIGPRGAMYKVKDADENEVMFGIAARIKLGSIGAEGTIDFKSEKYFDDQVTVSSTPMTLSALFYPLPMVYGLAGMGWYNTKTEYEFVGELAGLSGVMDEESQQTGYHLGAGLELALGTITLAADVRKVFLDYDLEGLPLSETVNADYMSYNITLLWGF